MKIIRSLSAASIILIFFFFACKDEVTSTNLTNCYSCSLPDADIYDDVINICDPEVVDKILSQYKTGKYDFCSNCLPYTFPDGLDAEIFSFQVLEKMIKNVKSDFEKEHVTVYIRNHLKEFRIFNFENDEDFSKFRWTVDFSADLEVVKRIYELMKPKDIFSFQEVFKKISGLGLNLKDFGLKD